MTNAELIQKIRAEIERLKGQLIRGACAAQISFETSCKDEAYNEILSFLDTIEEEPDEILEDAAWKYCEFTLNGETFHEEGQYDGFIAGAGWAMDKLPKWRESSKEYYTDKPKVYEGFGQFKLFWKDRVIDLNKVFETLPKK